MKCRECQDLLQRRLDGEAVPMTPAWKAHLNECRGCREDFAAAQVLVKGLAAPRTFTTPSAGLASRIVGKVVEDRRKRHVRSKIRWYAIWSMAASLLLIVGVTNFFPRKQDAVVVNPTRPKDELAQQPNLDRSAEEAKLAMTSLTERVAEKTKENALMLWQTARPTELPDVDPLQAVAEIDGAFDPAAQSLHKAGQAVTQGLEPMARSAARAIDYFSKELAIFDLPPTQ